MRRSGYTLEYIEAKIEKITIKYEEAKRNHDADAAHKIRANLAQWKRRKEILFGEQNDRNFL